MTRPSPRLRILADENLPGVRAACEPLGTLTTLPGEAIGAKQAAGADVLLLRSVTRVDAALLGSRAPLFVGTATSGFDHVDRALLRNLQVAFAHAPGCNATSVAEWFSAALVRLARRRQRPLVGACLGVVGVGRVGREVARCARALGLTVLLDDPPRQRQEGPQDFTPRPDLLARSDFVTLHVPLSAEGPDATLGLVDRGFFAAMRPGATLLNASRGGVTDGAALLEARQAGKLADVLLDVWPHEPRLAPALARATTLATPHVAGHSLDGKIAGTRMLIDALCARLGRPTTWQAPPLPSPPPIELDSTVGAAACAAQAVLRAYPIERDDAALRATLDLPADERAAAFGALRRAYWPRRGFAAWTVRARPRATAVDAALAGLGFRVT